MIPKHGKPKRRFRWIKRLGWTGLTLCALLAGAWFWIHSASGRAWLSRTLSQKLSSDEITVAVAPWEGRLDSHVTLPYIQVFQNDQTAIALEHLRVDPDLRSILRKQWTLNHAAVGHAEVNFLPTTSSSPASKRSPIKLPTIGIETWVVDSFTISSNVFGLAAAGSAIGSLHTSADQTGTAELHLTPTTPLLDPLSASLSFDASAGWSADLDLTGGGFPTPGDDTLDAVHLIAQISREEDGVRLEGKARATLSSTPQEMDITLLLQERLLSVSHVKVSLAGLNGEGSLNLDLDTLLADGALTLSLEAPCPLSTWINTNFQGRVESAIELSTVDGKQRLQPDVKISDFHWGPLGLKAATLQGHVTGGRQELRTHLKASLKCEVEGASFGTVEVDQANLHVDGSPFDFSTEVSAKGTHPFSYRAESTLHAIRSDGSWSFDIAALSGDAKGFPLALKEPTSFQMGPDLLTLAPTELTLGQWHLGAEGILHSNGFENVHLSVTDLDVHHLPGDTFTNYHGLVTASLGLSGSRSDPRIAFALTGTDLELPFLTSTPASPLTTAIEASFSQQRLALEATISGPHTGLQALARIPLDLNLAKPAIKLLSKQPWSARLDTHLVLEDLTPLPEGFMGAVTGTVVLAGTPASPAVETDLQLNHFRLPYPATTNLPPLDVKLAATIKNQRGQFSLQGGPTSSAPWIHAAGTLPLYIDLMQNLFALEPDAPMSLKLTHNVPLKDLGLLPPEIQGDLRAEAALAGSLNSPKISGSVTGASLSYTTEDTFVPLQGEAHLTFEGNDQGINGSGRVTINRFGYIDVTALAPMILDLSKGLVQSDSNKPSRISADCHLDLKSINVLPAFSTQSIAGLLDGSLRAERIGTNLTLTGELSLTEGAYEHFIWNTRLLAAKGTLRLADSRIILTDVRANDGGEGRLQGEAVFNLERQALSSDFALSRFRIVDTAALKVIASGSTHLTRTPTGQSLVGQLNVDEAVGSLDDLIIGPRTLAYEYMDVPSATPTATDPIEPAPKIRSSIDLTFRLKKNLRIKGRVLDSIWDGEARYLSINGKQSLTGELEVDYGWIDALGIRLDLAGGRVILNDRWPPEPELDIDAETHRFGVEATLGLRGTITQPRLELTSNPPMHRDEILSHLLFGKSLSEISTAQVLQLAAKLYQLRNPSQGLGLTQKAQDLLQVDYIDLRGDGERSEIAIGRQINNRLRTEVRQPLNRESGGSVVQAEYELRPHISIETEVGSEDDSHIGINWKVDY